MPASLKIEGLREVQARLKSLEAKTSKKYVRAALRTGANVVRDQARADAPVKTGLVKRSIRVSGRRAKKGVIALAVSIGKKLFTGKSFYGAFVELGHFTGKRLSGSYRGAGARERYARASRAKGRKWIEGRHFMQRAYEQKREAAVAAIIDKLKSLLAPDLKS